MNKIDIFLGYSQRYSNGGHRQVNGRSQLGVTHAVIGDMQDQKGHEPEFVIKRISQGRLP